MDKNAKIIQRIAKTKTEDVLHSSAYAKAQNGQAFGTTSSETFATRQSIANKRQFIQGYKSSHIATNSGFSTPRATSYSPPTEPTPITSTHPNTNSNNSPAHTYGVTPARIARPAPVPPPISAPRIPNRRPPAR